MRKHFRAANPSAGESQAGFVGWEGRVRFSLGNVAGGPGWRLRPLPQERLFAVGGLGASLAGEGAPGPPHCSAAARWDRGSRGAGGCPSSACGVPWRGGGGGRGGPASLCEFCAPPAPLWHRARCSGRGSRMLVAPRQRWRLSLPACGSPRSHAGLGLSAASWMRGAERGARLGPAPQAFGSRVPSRVSGRTWQLGGVPQPWRRPSLGSSSGNPCGEDLRRGSLCPQGARPPRWGAGGADSPVAVLKAASSCRRRSSRGCMPSVHRSYRSWRRR